MMCVLNAIIINRTQYRQPCVSSFSHGMAINKIVIDLISNCAVTTLDCLPLCTMACCAGECI